MVQTGRFGCQVGPSQPMTIQRTKLVNFLHKHKYEIMQGFQSIMREPIINFKEVECSMSSWHLPCNHSVALRHNDVGIQAIEAQGKQKHLALRRILIDIVALCAHVGRTNKGTQQQNTYGKLVR